MYRSQLKPQTMAHSRGKVGLAGIQIAAYCWLHSIHTEQRGRRAYKCQMYTKGRQRKGERCNNERDSSPDPWCWWSSPGLCDVRHSQQAKHVIWLCLCAAVGPCLCFHCSMFCASERLKAFSYSTGGIVLTERSISTFSVQLECGL